MSIYPFICKNLVLPLSDIFRGRSVYTKYQKLNEMQWWTKEQLEEHQNIQLQNTVRYAFEKVPYYNKIFKDRNLVPSDIKCTDDIIKLPVLNKKLIKTAGTSNIVYGDPKTYIKETTSGSSGEQGTFYLSLDAQSFSYAAELLFFNWGRYELGQTVLQTGMTLKRGFEKKIKDMLFRCKYVSAFNLTDNELHKIVCVIKKKKIEFIIGYASSLYCIADYMHRNQIKIKIRSAISLGDMLFDQYRKVIEEVFLCKVTDTYGSCEGFMIAGQCLNQEYHICMPLNYVEILDKDGNPSPIGEMGRVVLTRLDLNPMPLIRYEIGDIATLSKEHKCECGRGFTTMEKILGRDTDIVVTPKGHKLIVHFFTAIFEHETSISQFQVIQNEPDKISIKIIADIGFSNAVTDKIKLKIAEKCDDIKVEFEEVSDIPTTKAGKRRFVISKGFQNKY